MEKLISKLDAKNKLLMMQKKEAVGKYQKEVKNVFNLSEILSTIINVNLNNKPNFSFRISFNIYFKFSFKHNLIYPLKLP
jgi:hypothetical protein